VKNSLNALKCRSYTIANPQHHPSNFERKSIEDLSNQRKFMNWAAEQLNIKQPNDWYSTSYQDIIRIGGGPLLKYYKNSPSLLISTTFPEHRLLPWKFTVCSENFWNNIENQRKFMNWAAEQLNVKQPSDWYTVSAKVRKFSENSYNRISRVLEEGLCLKTTIMDLLRYS
jgi:hypothetical protein